MRALVLEEPGERPRLVLRDIPEPIVGPRDVLIRVAACGLCYHDISVIKGVLRRGVKPGVVLGHEVSGTVIQIGSEVSTLTIGNQIVSLLTEACGECESCQESREHRCQSGFGVGHGINGGFAELLCLRETAAVRIPEGITLDHASILACPLGVVWEALRFRGALKSGETCLVTGSGGGLGLHAIQVAKALGARTIAVTTSPQKIARLEVIADNVILANEIDFGEVALAMTQDQGVDVVVNTVGSAMFAGSFRALAPYGRLLMLGEIKPGSIEMNTAELLFMRAQLIGSVGTNKQHLLEVAQMVVQGRIQPMISDIYSLDDFHEGYQAVVRREAFGRVIVKPGA